jgi:hypothetical protein
MSNINSFGSDSLLNKTATSLSKPSSKADPGRSLRSLGKLVIVTKKEVNRPDRKQQHVCVSRQQTPEGLSSVEKSEQVCGRGHCNHRQEDLVEDTRSVAKRKKKPAAFMAREHVLHRVSLDLVLRIALGSTL